MSWTQVAFTVIKCQIKNIWENISILELKLKNQVLKSWLIKSWFTKAKFSTPQHIQFPWNRIQIIKYFDLSIRDPNGLVLREKKIGGGFLLWHCPFTVLSPRVGIQACWWGSECVKLSSSTCLNYFQHKHTRPHSQAIVFFRLGSYNVNLL